MCHALNKLRCSIFERGLKMTEIPCIKCKKRATCNPNTCKKFDNYMKKYIEQKLKELEKND